MGSSAACYNTHSLMMDGTVELQSMGRGAKLKVNNLRFGYTSSCEQKPSSWEIWWDKIQIIVQGMLIEAFECRNADEALYQHNLVSYAAAYLDHVYVPSSTDLTLSVVCEST